MLACRLPAATRRGSRHCFSGVHGRPRSPWRVRPSEAVRVLGVGGALGCYYLCIAIIYASLLFMHRGRGLRVEGRGRPCLPRLSFRLTSHTPLSVPSLPNSAPPLPSSTPRSTPPPPSIPSRAHTHPTPTLPHPGLTAQTALVAHSKSASRKSRPPTPSCAFPSSPSAPSKPGGAVQEGGGSVARAHLRGGARIENGGQSHLAPIGRCSTTVAMPPRTLPRSPLGPRGSHLQRR